MTKNTLRSLPGLGAYCLGLGIIVAATILNLAHDRLCERDIARLPFFLPELYDNTGKFGVTLLLTALGLSVILLGAASRRVRAEEEKLDRPHVPSSPLFYGPGDDGPADSRPAGAVVLTTRRYLAHANLSGTTGFPSRRAPKG
jgi:hypothetical protein